MTIHIGALSDLPTEARTIVLIGNRSCDHLREMIRMIEFRGRAAYRIEDATELQPRWFSGADVVGIVVGAASLHVMVQPVLDRLKQFAAAQSRGMLEGIAT